jgi:glycolate oxidase FAD binding subunit
VRRVTTFWAYAASAGAGEVFKAGARVVKNVTGYDLPKLMTGSYGTLAALTSVILKVLPKPETEETVVLTGLGDGEAVPP